MAIWVGEAGCWEIGRAVGAQGEMREVLAALGMTLLFLLCGGGVVGDGVFAGPDFDFGPGLGWA
jgi:hypothetical protein